MTVVNLCPSRRVFVHGFGHRVVQPDAAGNGLLNNLIAYWPGNEAAGNALDLHVNALHLTDNNTVTSNTGIVYPLARQYTAVNLEYHTRPGDDALLSTGDVDFTIVAWVYLDTLGSDFALVSKWNIDPQNEYILSYNRVPNRLVFYVSDDGTAAQSITASTFGALVANTWYQVLAGHDALNNQLFIQVNNGAIDTQAHNTGVFDSTARFFVGGRQDIGWYMNGRIGPTMFWKSAAGLGGVLSAGQRTALWAGGAGLPYASFTT